MWGYCPHARYRARANMSGPSLTRATSASPLWVRAWAALEPDFQTALRTLELDAPLAWNGLIGDEAETEDAMGVLGLLDVDEETQRARIEGATNLYRAARGIGANWCRAFAVMPSLQVSVDASLVANQ